MGIEKWLGGVGVNCLNRGFSRIARMTRIRNMCYLINPMLSQFPIPLLRL